MPEAQVLVTRFVTSRTRYVVNNSYKLSLCFNHNVFCFALKQEQSVKYINNMNESGRDL